MRDQTLAAAARATPASAARHELENDISGTDELWMVQAIIQPFRLDRVTRALEAITGFGGMTVTSVQGFGQEKLEDRRSADRGSSPSQPTRDTLDDFTKKLRLHIAISGRRRADDIAAVVARAAHTGNRGDGKIFMWQLAHVIRVRTMEVDRNAL